MKILVTGGSGFIGTNLIDLLNMCPNCEVANFDNSEPRNHNQRRFWKKGDILNLEQLEQTFREFKPEILIHLAARTDLDGKTLDDYRVNIEGVDNIIRVSNLVKSLKRVIFASSMLVCRLGYRPENDHDFQPSTAYGESKVEGEKMFRKKIRNTLEWVIIRPTSLWGPWFGTPYRDFFDILLNRIFLFPGKLEIVRSYGFIGNSVRQITYLMETKNTKLLNRVHYICDSEPINLYDWAQKIKAEAKRGRVARTPLSLLYLLASFGDALNLIGYKSFPLTRFRLKNMMTNSVLTNDLLVQFMGKDLYSLKDSIVLTLRWMEEQANGSVEN